MAGKKTDDSGFDDGDFNFGNDGSDSAPPPAVTDAADEFEFEEMPDPSRPAIVDAEPELPRGRATLPPPVEDEFDLEPEEAPVRSAAPRVERFEDEDFGGDSFDVDEVPARSASRGRSAAATIADDDAFDDANGNGNGGDDTGLGEDVVVDEQEEAEYEEQPRGQSPIMKYGFYGIIGLVVLGFAYYGYTSVLGPMLGLTGPSQSPSAAIETPALPFEQANNTPTPQTPALNGMNTVPDDLVPSTPTLPGDGAPALPTINEQPVPQTPSYISGDDQPDTALAERVATLEEELGSLSRADLIGKVATLEARLEALENQPQNAATPRPAVEPPAKPAVIGDWSLQGVQGDVAWVAGPNDVFLEVRAGSEIPSVGTVTSIDKYEGDWLVVTSAGVILQTQ